MQYRGRNPGGGWEICATQMNMKKVWRFVWRLFVAMGVLYNCDELADILGREGYVALLFVSHLAFEMP